MKTIRTLAVAISLCGLWACGGGGGSTGTTTPPSGAVVKITQQPASVSVIAPAPAQFAVSATTTTGSLHYQWTSRAPGANATTSVGNDSPTYTVDPTQPAMSGTTITVNVSADTDPVASAPALLVVNTQSSGGGTAVFVQTFGSDFSVVGLPNSGPFVSSYTVTAPTPLTPGNVVKVAIWAQGASLPPGVFSMGTVATDSGDQFQEISTDPSPPPNNAQRIFIFEGTITQPSSNIIVTPALPYPGCNFSNGCDSNLSIGASEYAGSTGAVDAQEAQYGMQDGTGTTFSLDPVVTHTTDVVFAAGQANTCHGGGIIAAGNGWTQRWTSPSWCFVLQDQLGTPAGTVTPTFFITPQANTEGWIGAIVATQ